MKNNPGRKDDLRRKLCGALALAVRSGEYTEKMPSVTQLAQQYSVNPLTVRRALDDLEEAGLIEKRPRVGTFVKHKRRIAILFFTHKIRPDNTSRTTYFFDSVIRGVQAYMYDKGIAVQIHTVASEQRDIIDKLKQDVDGFIVIAALDVKEKDFEVFSGIRWVRAMGGLGTYAPGGHVTYDNHAVGYMAADTLIRQGCKEFIYFGSATNYLFKNRLDTFRKRIEEYGHYKFHHIEIDANTMSIAAITECAAKAFKKLIVPGSTGLFLSSDMYATPVYQVLYSMGIRPLKDIQIVSCDNDAYYLNGLHPLPPTIDIRMFDIGTRAAEMLQTPGAKLEKIVLAPELVVGHAETVLEVL